MKELLQKITELLMAIYQVLNAKPELLPIHADADVWLDAYDVTRKLNISRTTLYRRRIEGDFICKKIGKQWVYLQSSVS